MDRKKIFGIFGGFLAVMLVFTILSRAVSGASMAKVETVKISTGTIDHKVSGSGRTVAGKEIAVYTESGQRVKEICVQEGQSVEEGEVLFLVDLEELEEQILAAQQELEKLKLQNQDTQSAQSVERQNRENARNRAVEDYNSAVTQGNSTVTQAKAAWDKAEQELQQFLQTSPKPDDAGQGQDQVTQEEEKSKGTKDKENQGAREESGIENNPEMGEAASVGDDAPESQKDGKIGTRDTNGENNTGTQGGIDAAAEWEAKKAALEQAVAEAKAVYDNAISTRSENIKSAERALEDASARTATDSTGQQNEITRQQQELALEKLLKLKDAEGKVLSPVRGMVTQIAVTTGDFTSEGTAMRLADTSKGCRIVATMDKANEKYISKGSAVTISVSGNKEKITGYTVSKVAEHEEDKNMLEVTVELPEGVVEAGTLADIEIIQKSKTYNSILPIQALHEEQSGCYVLILQEEQGVMGVEFVAKRFEVEVLDKNGTQVALAEGILTGEQEIINSSSRMIEDGSRVRRKVE